MSAALALFRLQQVDRQMDQSRARMDAIRQVLENDTELREALARLEAARKKHADAAAHLHSAETQAKDQQIKIEQAESSLYGGAVHNPKELQDLQNDVASLKRHLATLEERQLEAMLDVDEAQAGLQSAQSALDDLQSRRGDDHRRLIEEQTTLSRNMERLVTERLAVMASVSGQALQIYDQLRERRRGIAVAEVTDNSCSACGTTLTAALQQNAHSTSQVAYCPSCGRILFAS